MWSAPKHSHFWKPKFTIFVATPDLTPLVERQLKCSETRIIVIPCYGLVTQSIMNKQVTLVKWVADATGREEGSNNPKEEVVTSWNLGVVVVEHWRI